MSVGFLSNDQGYNAITAVEKYDTGWINTNDWEDRQLGSTATPKNTDSNVAHNLNCRLSDLIVKLFVSTDGTDANSFEVPFGPYYQYLVYGDIGITVFEVDNNNILVQTGYHGFCFINKTDSYVYIIRTEDWYYKVVVMKPNTGQIVMSNQGSAPAGSVQMFAGSSAPAGWFLCDGTAISRTSYKNLFAAISTTYGVGDGSTTFNIPDFRGIFPRGAGSNGTLDNANGDAFSGTLGTYQNDKMQGHKHHITSFSTTYGAGSSVVAGSYVGAMTEYVSTPDTDGTNGTPRTGTETNPANLSINFIIKI